MAWSEAARAAAAEARRLHRQARMDTGLMRRQGEGRLGTDQQATLAKRLARGKLRSITGKEVRKALADKLRLMRAGTARFRDIGVMKASLASTVLRNAARRK